MIGAQIALALLLVVLVLVRRRLLDGPPGRLLALVALVAFPLFLTAEVGSYHLEHAERTRFCLACHEMAPFGRGLEAQDPAQLAAAHYQNRWVAPESACYACHTDYAMHGDLKAKLRGLQHAWVHYVGTPVEPSSIRLYEPYDNENCLHCHGGARRFEQALPHVPSRQRLEEGSMSCLSCHGPVHVLEMLPSSHGDPPDDA